MSDHGEASRSRLHSADFVPIHDAGSGADREAMRSDTLLEAARLIDAAADDVEYTVLASPDVPGMRKAARLLRLHALAGQRQVGEQATS